jgi:hypothetical protein
VQRVAFPVDVRQFAGKRAIPAIITYSLPCRFGIRKPSFASVAPVSAKSVEISSDRQFSGKVPMTARLGAVSLLGLFV